MVVGGKKRRRLKLTVYREMSEKEKVRVQTRQTDEEYSEGSSNFWSCAVMIHPSELKVG